MCKKAQKTMARCRMTLKQKYSAKHPQSSSNLMMLPPPGTLFQNGIIWYEWAEWSCAVIMLQYDYSNHATRCVILNNGASGLCTPSKIPRWLYIGAHNKRSKGEKSDDDSRAHGWEGTLKIELLAPQTWPQVMCDFTFLCSVVLHGPQTA